MFMQFVNMATFVSNKIIMEFAVLATSNRVCLVIEFVILLSVCRK